MNNEEQKLEAYVNSIQFDDAPRAEHRERLEKRVMQAYETKTKYGDYQEPVAVYMRKLAFAAGFLIVCGLLFWTLDKAVITDNEPDFIAKHPDKEQLKKIIKEENATGVEKKELVARMKDIWEMVKSKDTDALVSVLQTDDFAYNLRLWAAKYLGQLGNQQTLTLLENTIDKMAIDDPNDPLKIAATKIRKKLNLPDPEQTEEKKPYEAPGMRSMEDASK